MNETYCERTGKVQCKPSDAARAADGINRHHWRAAKGRNCGAFHIGNKAGRRHE